LILFLIKSAVKNTVTLMLNSSTKSVLMLTSMLQISSTPASPRSLFSKNSATKNTTAIRLTTHLLEHLTKAVALAAAVHPAAVPLQVAPPLRKVEEARDQQATTVELLLSSLESP